MNIRHTHCLVSPEGKKIRFFEKAEHAAAEYLYGPCLCFIMPPTSKKLRGHIGFVLSVRAPVHPCFRSSHFLMHAISNEPCMLGFWNFIYAFLMEKQLTHIFSCPSYLPFWSYSPLKKSEWNLIQAICYEPCMLGFWNFIYGFLMGSPFLELCLFEKSEWKVVSRIHQKVFELGAWDLGSWCRMMSGLPENHLS